MKNGTALLVAFILGSLGFVAMYLVLSRPADGGPRDGRVRIVVASRELKAGQKITPEDLRLKEFPAAGLSYAHVEESAGGNLLGRTLRVRVPEGEPILAPAIESDTASGAVEIESQLRHPDTHAVSMELDAPGSVAGLLKPGQKVDVMATMDVSMLRILAPASTRDDWQAAMGAKKEDDGKAITWTFLLLQNRTVLAVDVRASSRWEGDPRETESHVVTIAVTAEEALKVAQTQAKGRIHLIMRNRTDSVTVRANPNPICPGDLFPAGHWYEKRFESARK